MLLLRESKYLAVPWKNGGGVTREICREPPEPAPFDWRLSLATIDRAGPFSHFPGYQRTLVLVRGAGVELDFGVHGGATLARTGQLAIFDGAWATACRLLEGASSDLNLIVSQERAESYPRCVPLCTAERIETAGWTETYVCCVEGPVEITTTATGTLMLGPVDVARCREDDGPVTCRPATSGAASVFLASVRRRPHPEAP